MHITRMVLTFEEKTWVLDVTRHLDVLRTIQPNNIRNISRMTQLQALRCL